MIADYILDPVNENGWMTLNEVCTVRKVTIRGRTVTLSPIWYSSVSRLHQYMQYYTASICVLSYSVYE